MAIRSLKSGSFSRSVQVGNSIILPGDYESIATVSVGAGGSSSIVFSSIPQTFTHLQLRMFGIGNAQNRICIAYNSNTTTSDYNSHYTESDGSTAYTGNVTGVAGNTYYTQTTTYPFTSIVDILDYTNTNKYKVQRAISGNDRNGGGTTAIYSSLWLKTDAINSLTITITSSSFAQYSHFALYGVK